MIYDNLPSKSGDCPASYPVRKLLTFTGGTTGGSHGSHGTHGPEATADARNFELEKAESEPEPTGAFVT